MMRWCAIVFGVLLVRLAAQDSAPAARPVIKDFGLKPYVRVSKDLPHAEDRPWRLVCTLPENSHFQPWIEVEAKPGLTILFNSTNPLTSTKNDGVNPCVWIVSIHHNAGGTPRAGDLVLCPRDAQNHDAASASAEAAR